MLCKGAPIVIKLSNVNDATIASIVTDAPGGICEEMMLSIQPIIDVATRNPKGMFVCVKGDSGSGVVAQSRPVAGTDRHHSLGRRNPRLGAGESRGPRPVVGRPSAGGPPLRRLRC